MSIEQSYVSRFNLLPESSPMAMVTRAAEARAEVSAMSEWLELAKRDEGRDTEAVKRCAESIQSECKWCWGVNTVGDIRLFIKFGCWADTPAGVMPMIQNKFSKTFFIDLKPYIVHAVTFAYVLPLHLAMYTGDGLTIWLFFRTVRGSR